MFISDFVLIFLGCKGRYALAVDLYSKEFKKHQTETPYLRVLQDKISPYMFYSVIHERKEPSEFPDITTNPNQVDSFHFEVLVQRRRIQISKGRHK